MAITLAPPAFGDPRLPARFWAKTAVEDRGHTTSCIVWTAYRGAGGYGQFHFNGRACVTHRLAYEQLVGPVPDGLQLDHLCRTRACVNIEHLEPVTQLVNLHRGDTVTAVNAAKTHCPQGHEYNAENTYLLRRGWRKCRACNRDRMTVRNERARKARSQ